MQFLYFQYFFHLFDRQNGRGAQFIHCCAQSSYSIDNLHLHRFVSMACAGDRCDSDTIHFFSYIVWYQRGYQEFQEPRGTSVTKVKGVSSVDLKNPSTLASRTSY